MTAFPVTNRCPCEHLAGVHADPGGQPEAPRTFELIVEGGQRVAHLHRGPNRKQGIVLVHDRDAEDCHDGVADVLLDDAPMTLDDLMHRAEVARQHVPVRLRIELPGQPRRIDQVGEEDGDCLAHIRLFASLDRRLRLRFPRDFRRLVGSHDRRARLEQRILPKHRLLELSQRKARLDPELFDKQASRLFVGLQGSMGLGVQRQTGRASACRPDP